MTDRLSGNAYWNATADATDFPRLFGDLEVDVAIVGGGIVGITTARLLKDRGLRVAVIEARRVGRQVTGQSTAKVTSQHGILYQTLESKFGEDKARLYAEAQEAGLGRIRDLAAGHGIDADIETVPAFVYTKDESYVETIEKEVETARRFGLPASLTRETGLPFDVLTAMRWDDQAQFHPTKYVAGLAATIPGGGCHVFESSPVIDYEPTRVATAEGSVKARRVVMATHLPLGQIGLFYSFAHAKAEAIVAAPIPSPLAAVYKNAEQPSRSIRTHRGSDGRTYAVAAGAHYTPGDSDQEEINRGEIERWLTNNFGAGPIEYRWVNEDYTAVDHAPFVGWSSGEDSYLVATGFGAWGLTNGTAAAMIIADLATGKENIWSAMFDAGRIKPIAGAADFMKGNAAVAKHLVGGYLSRKLKDLDALPRGEAAIMKLDGENVAAFRDDDGAVHAVSAACTHMGCILGWNGTDRTWDCPCHGSRFGLAGEVIHGPATTPLEVKAVT